MKERLIIIEFAAVIVFFLTAYWILFRKIPVKKLNRKKGPRFS